jgi:hypothetical protein
VLLGDRLLEAREDLALAEARRDVREQRDLTFAVVAIDLREAGVARQLHDV